MESNLNLNSNSNSLSTDSQNIFDVQRSKNPDSATMKSGSHSVDINTKNLAEKDLEDMVVMDEHVEPVVSKTHIYQGITEKNKLQSSFDKTSQYTTRIGDVLIHCKPHNQANQEDKNTSSLKNHAYQLDLADEGLEAEDIEGALVLRSMQHHFQMNFNDLPPATGTETEIPSAVVTNSAQLSHPPYDVMITAAISAMKEKDGSSRQAIAKYIESEFKNLSMSHASLLTQHLRKMKNMGKLVMNKHSYMLSGSGVSQSQSVVVAEGSSAGTKRKPGRPPKIQSNGGGVDGVGGSGGGSVSGVLGVTAPFDPIGAVPNVVPMGEVDGETSVKRRPGRPPKMHTVVVEAEPIAVAEPGVAAEVAKVGRRPGRPPKVNNGKEVVSVGRRPGRPPKVNNGIVVVGEGGSVLGKRGRGRGVKKTGMVSALMGIGGGFKRGRGRPPKMRAIGLVMGQRPRGRPRKGTVLKPRGRPRKNAAAGVGDAIIVPVEGMEDAGGPSKLAVRRKPRKLSGKPLGRPKKGKSALAIESSNQQQSISYQDLKGRFEHFQSRVKHAVDVVKPYLSNEVASVALGVLQEIEGLALMDTCAPVPGGAVIGESAAVTGLSGAPLSAQAGPRSDPVAPSGQGSEPPNLN